MRNRPLTIFFVLIAFLLRTAVDVRGAGQVVLCLGQTHQQAAADACGHGHECGGELILAHDCEGTHGLVLAQRHEHQCPCVDIAIGCNDLRVPREDQAKGLFGDVQQCDHALHLTTPKRPVSWHNEQRVDPGGGQRAAVIASTRLQI